MELDEGAEQWRMISDSILYGGDADDAALHMELMEEVYNSLYVLYSILKIIFFVSLFVDR